MIQAFRSTSLIVRASLIILLAAFLEPARGAEKDYCSLVVSVRGPEGQPLTAKVSVVDTAGHRLDSRTSPEGKAEFCPLGIKPVDVTVGGGGCGTVTVKQVELFWQQTQELPVTWSPCWLKGDPPPLMACSILLRVYDDKGAPIKGAKVKTQYGLHSELSDRYGRIRLGVGYGKTLEGSVSAPGFEDTTYSVDCSRSEGDVEREIKLQNRE
jgi:hypothetical protein